MLVLDTNVLSELMKGSPALAVTNWADVHDRDPLYITAVTVAEIRYGVERLRSGQRRELLSAAADEVFAGFDEQILPFDAVAAGIYPDVVTRRERTGRPIDGFDAQIAAICLARGAALVTRNIKDFTDAGLELIDPWHSRRNDREGRRGT